MVTFVILFMFVFPILWVYITSIKSEPDIFSLDFSKLFVFPPTFEHFDNLFNETPFFLEITNTFIASVVSTAFVMLISLPAAYSFARFNTGGRAPAFYYYFHKNVPSRRSSHTFLYCI